MRIRTVLLGSGAAAALASAGCTHASAKLMVDAPKLLPYQAPDIDEITGIDSSDTPDPAPAPAADPKKK